MQNRVMNVNMTEAKKTDLAHLMETAIWRLLRPINTVVVDPQNKITGVQSPTTTYNSDVQVPVKHDFSETF